jgi:hypothetical protein
MTYMNLENVREYCLTEAGATEDTPFDPDALVLKVAGKMFALASITQLPLPRHPGRISGSLAVARHRIRRIGRSSGFPFPASTGFQQASGLEFGGKAPTMNRS